MHPCALCIAPRGLARGMAERCVCCLSMRYPIRSVGSLPWLVQFLDLELGVELQSWREEPSQFVALAPATSLVQEWELFSSSPLLFV